MFVNQFEVISSPSHTGSRLFWEAGFLVNPGAHSHLYDPIVLLQTWSERHASDDWHSSTSAQITKKGRREKWLTHSRVVNENKSLHRELKNQKSRWFAYTFYAYTHKGTLDQAHKNIVALF